MCGIVGYIGEKDATPIILKGLKKLEYRGYDSAGLAVLTNGHIEVRRDAGKLANLEHLVDGNPIHGKLGIGHTRWATHGEPSARNAHPHMGSTGKVVVVHNGIVENFIELKEELVKDGVKFQSDTDTETIVLLVEKYMQKGMGLEDAARTTLSRLKGAHGVVMFSSLEPDKIVAARIGNAGGVVLGLGEGENFIASDIPAIMEHTRRLIFLESRQMAVVKRDGITITTIDGKPITPQISSIAWDSVAAEKGEYRHFMQKEIHEQVRALNDTLAGRVDFEEGTIRLPQLNLDDDMAKQINKIVITACGTAWHAGMVGRICSKRSPAFLPTLRLPLSFAMQTQLLIITL
jgi:glutamine---fructose-6-phosphate transaminase (isomerizing)